MARGRSWSVALVLVVSVTLATVQPAAGNTLKAYATQHGATMAGDLLYQSVNGGSSRAPRSGALLDVVMDPATTSLDPVLAGQLARPAGGRATPTGVGRILPTNVRAVPKAPGALGMILNTGGLLLSLGGLPFGPDDAVSLSPEAPRPALLEGGPTRVVAFSGQTVPADGFLTNETATHGAWRWRTAPTLAAGWRYNGTAQWRSSASAMTRPDGRAVANGSDTNSVTENCWRSGVPENAVSLYKAPTTGVTADGTPWTQASPRIFQNPRVDYIELTCSASIISDPGGVAATATITHRVFNPDTAPPGDSFEPFEVTTTVECLDAAGTVTELTSSLVVTGGPEQEWVPPSVECPAGQVAGAGRVDAEIDGESVNLLPSTSAPDWVKGLPAAGVDVSGSLALVLEVLDPTQGTWVSCVARPELCLDWQTRPEGQQASNFRCRYGSATVSMDACGAFRFDPEDTAQPSIALPAPAPAGSPITSPSTASPVPAGSTCPPPVSFTSFFTGRLAYDAVTCSLSWAFVPKTAGASMQQASGLLTGRPPFTVFASFGAFGTSMWDGVTSGCVALPDFSPAQDGTLRLPCEPPNSPPLEVLRVIAIAGVWVTGALLIWREIDAGLGKSGGAA